jgi:hypothetical protein
LKRPKDHYGNWVHVPGTVAKHYFVCRVSIQSLGTIREEMSLDANNRSKFRIFLFLQNNLNQRNLTWTKLTSVCYIRPMKPCYRLQN